MDEVTISVADVRAGINRVLDAIEAKHGSEFGVEHDFYWSLDVEAAFTVDVPSPAVQTGQLSDDIDAIRTLLTEPQIVAPWHELGHLCGLLRAIELHDLPRS